MKRIFLFAIVLFSLTSNAQNCESYYLMQNNKTVEMTIYSKKGDVSGRQIYTVTGVANNGGSTTATIKSEMFDKKGKSISTATNTIKCSNGTILMNLKMMMPQQQGAAADVSAEGEFIDYPTSIAVGENLKDANLNLEMSTNGMKQTLAINIANRKVEGKETVTTSAGTWDAYKISFTGKMNIKTMGIGLPMNISGTEWFVPGFGIVKTESATGKTEITAIK